MIPLLILFDGTVSILRLYLEDELRELVAAVPGGEEFEWDVGAIGVGGSSIGPCVFDWRTAARYAHRSARSGAMKVQTIKAGLKTRNHE